MAGNQMQKDIDQLETKIDGLARALAALKAQQVEMVKVMAQMQKGGEEVDKRVDTVSKSSSGGDTVDKLEKQLAITDDRGLRTHVALGNLVKRVIELENKVKASK